MCSIGAHQKENLSEYYDGSSGVIYPLPLNSTAESFISLSEIINFICCWLQVSENNSLERSNMYFENMKNCFIKYQLNFLNQLVIRKNSNLYYMILEVVGAWTSWMRIFLPLKKRTNQKSTRKGKWNSNKICKWIIKIGMTGDLRYTEINLDGSIQEIIINKKKYILCVFLKVTFER